MGDEEPPPRLDPRKRIELFSNPGSKKFKNNQPSMQNKMPQCSAKTTPAKENTTLTPYENQYFNDTKSISTNTTNNCHSNNNNPSNPSNIPKNTNKTDIYSYDNYENQTILYSPAHPGPYYVLLTSDEPICPRRKNSELHLYAKLASANINAHFVSKNIAYKTFRLSFNNYNSANNFVLDPNVKSIGLNAFIPDRFVQKFYVIKSVPVEFTGKMIYDQINSSDNDFKAVSVYRFKYKNENGQYVPSQTIKVGIVADYVVKELKMFNSIVETDLYIPLVRLCKNCGRLGHIAVKCRAKKRCLLCGINIECPTNCTEPKCDTCLSTIKCKTYCILPRCILCNMEDHNAMDVKKCKRYSNEKNILEAMAITNLSRKECIPKVSNNYFEILDEPNYENQFPQISKTSRRPVTSFNDELNRRRTKVNYNKVAASIPRRTHITAEQETIVPSKPSFEFSNFFKVSEYEKILSTFTQQMAAALTNAKCTEGLQILDSFSNALKAPAIDGPSSSNQTEHDNLTAQHTKFE